MHAQGNALRRWFSNHRPELTLTAALGLMAAVLLIALPWLLLLGAVEWKTIRRRRILGLAVAGQLLRASRWLWCELTDTPHGPWHPCAQCGLPIDDRSQAAYCSHACRRYARLERDAQANDPRIADRAERRLRAIRLQTLADQNPDWAEVPF